ncbi:MAG: hypothetical protein QOI80_1336 [Solirubrobacteraceae bacterium]|nr:hypothetical protein [Solirubrobacteraceae bacterium]
MLVERRPLAAERAVRRDGAARRIGALEHERALHVIAAHDRVDRLHQRRALRDGDELDGAQAGRLQLLARPAVGPVLRLVVDGAQVLEHDDGGHEALVVLGVEPPRGDARAAVAPRRFRHALVEVRGAEGELDRARPARLRQCGEVARHRHHRDRAVVLVGVGPVGVAVDDQLLRAGAGDGRVQVGRGHALAAHAQRHPRRPAERVLDALALVGAEEEPRDAPGRALVGLVVPAQLAAGEVLDEQQRLRPGRARVAQVLDPRVVVDEVAVEVAGGVDRVARVVRLVAHDRQREERVLHRPGRCRADDDLAARVVGGDRLVVGDEHERPADATGAVRVGHRAGDGDAGAADRQGRPPRRPAVDVQLLLRELDAGDGAQRGPDRGDVVRLRGAAGGARAEARHLRGHRLERRGVRQCGGVGRGRARA